LTGKNNVKTKTGLLILGLPDAVLKSGKFLRLYSFFKLEVKTTFKIHVRSSCTGLYDPMKYRHFYK
jgi:hypothetical protein